MSSCFPCCHEGLSEDLHPDQTLSLLQYVSGAVGASGFGARSTIEDVAMSLGAGCASGRVALVTGAASPIAIEVCKHLAALGMHVVVCCRTQDQADSVAAAVQAFAGGAARATPLGGDLSSLAEVASLSSRFHTLGLPLHLLINSAAAGMAGPLALSQDGYELQFAVDYLAHFLLTERLLPQMAAAGLSGGRHPPRVVNVTCSAHYLAYMADRTTGGRGVRYPTLSGGRPWEYSPMAAFGQAKLAGALHMLELARRAPEVVSLAVHPGVCESGVQRAWMEQPGSWVQAAKNVVAAAGMRTGLLKSPSQAAASVLYAALHPDLHTASGCYIADCQVSRPSKHAQDIAAAQELRDASVKLIRAALAPPDGGGGAH